MSTSDRALFFEILLSLIALDNYSNRFENLLSPLTPLLFVTLFRLFVFSAGVNIMNARKSDQRSHVAHLHLSSQPQEAPVV